MTNPTSSTDTQTSSKIAEIYLKLQSSSDKAKLQLIQQLADMGEAGLLSVMEWLLEQQPVPANAMNGKAYQVLYNSGSLKATEFLQTHFPKGLVALKSEREIDYSTLQKQLAEQDFQAADALTLQKLCELAGEAAIRRKWLYFTEVDSFPITDLKTIDKLWLVHSEGKFGFSAQQQIWLSVGKNWEKFWPKIGWKTGNNWTRYPNEFTWDLAAPKGHLPLSNQLRGVRVISALLSHVAWNC